MARSGTNPTTSTVSGSVTVAEGAGVLMADTTANPTIEQTASFGMLFNGATWDRIRSGTTTGSVLVNNPTAANLFVSAVQSGTWTVQQGTAPWAFRLQDGTTGQLAVVDAAGDLQVDVNNFPATQAVTQSGTWTVQQGGSPWGITGTHTPADTYANPTDAVDVIGLSSVFNGTTWDRLRAGTATGSVLINNPTAANLLVSAVQSGTWNVGITGNASVVGTHTLSDAYANPTDAVNDGAMMMTFNGTTWDRIRSGNPTGDPGAVGVPAISLVVSDGAAFRRVDSPANTGDGVSMARNFASGVWGFNGTTWDRQLAARSDIDAVPTTLRGNLQVNNQNFLFNGTTWDRARASAAGTGASLVGGNQTPADKTANPTDAVDTRDFLMAFNPVTGLWDRLQKNPYGGLAVDLTPVTILLEQMLWEQKRSNRLLELLLGETVVFENLDLESDG